MKEESRTSSFMTFLLTLLLLLYIRSTLSAVLFSLGVDSFPNSMLDIAAILGAILVTIVFALVSYCSVRLLKDELCQRAEPDGSTEKCPTATGSTYHNNVKSSAVIEDYTDRCNELEKRLEKLIITGENIHYTIERMKPRDHSVAKWERECKTGESELPVNIKSPPSHQDQSVPKCRRKSITFAEGTEFEHCCKHSPLVLTPEKNAQESKLTTPSPVKNIRNVVSIGLSPRKKAPQRQRTPHHLIREGSFRSLKENLRKISLERQGTPSKRETPLSIWKPTSLSDWKPRPLPPRAIVPDSKEEAGECPQTEDEPLPSEEDEECPQMEDVPLLPEEDLPSAQIEDSSVFVHGRLYKLR